MKMSPSLPYDPFHAYHRNIDLILRQLNRNRAKCLYLKEKGHNSLFSEYYPKEGENMDGLTLKKSEIGGRTSSQMCRAKYYGVRIEWSPGSLFLEKGHFNGMKEIINKMEQLSG